MKKIKYLSLIVLSLLFVGFSFAETGIVDLSSAISYNSIMFEYPTVSQNIFYDHFNRLSVFDSFGNSSYVSYNYSSLFGSYNRFPLDSWGLAFSDSFGGLFSNSNYKSLLVMKKNLSYNTLYPDFINSLSLAQYYSSYSSGGIISFTNTIYPDYSQSLFILNSFLRFFYSPTADYSNSFWYNTTSPSVVDISDNPIYFQKFKSDEIGFLTQKGRVSIGNYGTLIGITPALSMGFGFFKNYNGGTNWNNLVFGTIFPFYDSYQSNGNYTLPSWAYTNQYYMFRLDSRKQNSDAGHVGLISKCTSEICGTGLYSDLLYSEYYCNLPGNGLTINTSTKYINLKESCLFARGGILRNALPFTGAIDVHNFALAGGDSRFLLPNVEFYGNACYYFVGNFGSWNGYSNDCLGTLDTSVFVDILGSFQNNTGYVPDPEIFQKTPRERAIDTLCNLPAFGRNPICSDGIFDSSDSTDIIFDTDTGGNLYAVVTIYDTGDENCPDMYYTGSDGYRYHQYFDRVCHFAIQVDYTDSTPDLEGGHITDGFWSYEDTISNYFYDIIDGSFKFYSCPFNSPLRALSLSSIGGLSSFLLDKFFDVNLVGPFNCLIGGALYSMTDGNDLASGLFPYDGPKYFVNFPDNVKKIINFGLVSLILMLFWKFRPNNHDE